MVLVGIPAWAWATAWALSVLAAWRVGAGRDRPVVGALAGLVLGPVGIAVACFLPYGGDMTCPACGKRTAWAPMPPGWTPQSGTSYPHLRCKRCGEIIPG